MAIEKYSLGTFLMTALQGLISTTKYRTLELKSDLLTSRPAPRLLNSYCFEFLMCDADRANVKKAPDMKLYQNHCILLNLWRNVLTNY